MMKLNWKKSMAAVLAGIMSFGVLSTTLAVPAEASSRRTDPPRIEQDRDTHRRQPSLAPWSVPSSPRTPDACASGIRK